MTEKKLLEERYDKLRKQTSENENNLQKQLTETSKEKALLEQKL